MNSKNVVIGGHYRHRDTPTYGWAKCLSVLPPRKGLNTHGYLVARCEWAVEKNALLGLIKYFKLSDLIEGQ
ncbi:hypothetical protein LCGC14_0543910 [marine sediment metagenome]|uniref:Uncharacterized protein n=1 Tax=marine sediment metagenome TaxID=412755 RepID=A0A0F9SAL8_9ZZZZ